MSDDTDRESYYYKADNVWQRGCQGEALSEREYEGFHRMARNRFYTFVMSINHSQVQGDADKIHSLVRSLALDLVRSPGLESEWHECEWANESFGALVTDMLPEVRSESESPD
ncbi:MAG: hypothetical protein U5O39_06785 [Gammaproteobacteria bacterium]|nr:hypothetical protein [Gammaproteobacteria bacterium]